MHIYIRVKNHTHMHASGSRSSTIDICIIHTCIRVEDRGKLINASYMHVSGIRIMDKCIIGMCIMVTCIRIKNICIAHAYKHQGQESYIHACFRIKDVCIKHILLLESPCPSVRDKICRIMDICITHTCSIVKYQGSWMYASYINASCTYA